jgi:serine/threonine protein kinase
LVSCAFPFKSQTFAFKRLSTLRRYSKVYRDVKPENVLLDGVTGGEMLNIRFAPISTFPDHLPVVPFR